MFTGATVALRNTKDEDPLGATFVIGAEADPGLD